MIKRAIVFALCALPLTAFAASDKEKAEKYFALTPDYFERTAVLKDSGLDITAEINTLGGYRETHGLLKFVWDDSFYRAYVDKKTGVARIQVYQTMYYQGDWRFYNRVTYESPSGPVAGDFTKIATKVISCAGSAYGGCTHTEDFAFTVPESLLRTVAAFYKPGELKAWRFKFGAQSGAEWTGGFSAAETAGFLAVLDKYRADNGLPAYAEVTAPAESKTADIGTAAGMNAELRKKAKEALDRGDTKTAKQLLDMVVE